MRAAPPPLYIALFILALVLLYGAKIALAVVGYNAIAPLLSGRPENRQASQQTAFAVAVAVRRAARLVPGATCLVRACAARFLLSRLGYRSVFHLGVRPDDTGKFEAHCWVTAGRVLVTGGPGSELSSFVTMAETS